MCILKGCKDSASRMQRACFLLRRSLFSQRFFKKALQRYYFLRTQPNKLHKIGQLVHRLVDLCNVTLYEYLV